MKKVFLIIISILIVKFSSGQDFTDLYGDYLGQIVPSDTPVIFAPGIISGESLEHSAAIFSRDGNEVYWCTREKDSNEKIMFMTQINNRWTTPEVLNPLGDSVVYFDPFLSDNGKRLYFTSNANIIIEDGVSRVKQNNDFDIWFIDKQGNTWGEPQRLSPVINTTDGQCQASFTGKGTIYFANFRVDGEKWIWNICRSKFKNGEYIRPDTLFQGIDSMQANWTPFIAPDDSYIIFASNRQDPHCDLYISFHNIRTDTWTEPVNMGEPVNTNMQETYPSVSPDGKYLFFTRYSKGNSMDIYWVSTGIIDRLREKGNVKK